MIYFAYGSNMNWKRMQARCPSARFLFPARLKQFRLEFTHFSKTNAGGVADILPDRSSSVWGVVYHIFDNEQDTLDRHEGVHLNAYQRFTVDVHPDGDRAQRLKAISYVVVTKEDPRPKPRSTYMQLILDGAIHWRLPDDYVTRLRSIETQP